MSCRIAIRVAGPSGVGKSLLCQELRQDIWKFCQAEIGFVYADAYSHLTFPWRGDAEQLSIKYRAICASLDIITPVSRVILIEDTLRRQEDVQLIDNYFAMLNIALRTILLNAQPATLIDRNRLREWPHRVEDAKILELLNLHCQLFWPPETIAVDAECGPAELRTRVFTIIQPQLMQFCFADGLSSP